MANPTYDADRSSSTNEFISFEKIEIRPGAYHGFTLYSCQIKSLRGGKEIDLSVQIELPHSDKTLSEIHREIAQAIHEATDPAQTNP
jgi:hypothetical protein